MSDFSKSFVRGLVIFLYDLPVLAVLVYLGIFWGIPVSLLGLQDNQDIVPIFSLIVFIILIIQAGRLRGRSPINALFLALGLLNIQFKKIEPKAKAEFEKYRKGKALWPSAWTNSQS